MKKYTKLIKYQKGNIQNIIKINDIDIIELNKKFEVLKTPKSEIQNPKIEATVILESYPNLPIELIIEKEGYRKNAMDKIKYTQITHEDRKYIEENLKNII